MVKLEDKNDSFWISDSNKSVEKKSTIIHTGIKKPVVMVEKLFRSSEKNDMNIPDIQRKTSIICHPIVYFS